MKLKTKTRMMRMLAMLTMFALGMLTGVGLTVALVSRAVERHLHTTQVDAHHRLLARDISRTLDLDETEQGAVREALAAQRLPHSALLRAHEVKLVPVRREAFSRMRASMSKHNQRALDEYLDQLETRRFMRHDPPISPDEVSPLEPPSP